jgi:hypothetical protein
VSSWSGAAGWCWRRRGSKAMVVDSCRFGPGLGISGSRWDREGFDGIAWVLCATEKLRIRLVRAATPCRWCFPSWRCCLIRGTSECLECGGSMMEGASVAGHHHFVVFPLLPFIFSLGMFVMLYLFFCSELLYRYGCYINIAGRKPKLAHHHFFFLIPNKHMNWFVGKRVRAINM